jgi:hypothetical protein
MEMCVAKAGDSIKVHITNDDPNGFGGESVWAKALGNNHARINNLPFFIDNVGYDDTVRYEIEDGIREFKEVIVKRNDSWGVSWEPTDKDDTEQTTEEWHKITDHLNSNNVHHESCMAGIFVIALPADQEKENIIWLKALKYSCPIELKVYFGEDED